MKKQQESVARAKHLFDHFRGSLKHEKKHEEETQQQAWQACNLALNHAAQSTRPQGDRGPVGALSTSSPARPNSCVTARPAADESGTGPGPVGRRRCQATVKSVPDSDAQRLLGR